MPFGRDLVMRGAEERLAPILMTALATGLALLPIALGGDRAGSGNRTPARGGHPRRARDVHGAESVPAPRRSICALDEAWRATTRRALRLKVRRAAYVGPLGLRAATALARHNPARPTFECT